MITRDSEGRPVIPIAEIRIGNEALTSREQAGLVMENFEPIGVVILDFTDIPKIGLAFADELFRVQPQTHPALELRVINASDAILDMIRHVLAQPAKGGE
ncbi:MAG: hypothetical protein EHM62_05645 [Methylococcus sp.]|nr:MAG: hypothetical protein EHM62_05645 [Methylococcus sp.]